MTKRRLLLAALLPAVVALVVALTTGSPAPARGSGPRLRPGAGLLAGGTLRVPTGFALPAATPPPVATAIAYAVRQLGKTYSETVDGGVGPDDYDCSGLVQQAYAAAGIALPRTTFTQYEVGQPVTGVDHIEAGDLIYIPGSDPGAGGAPGHVAMSIGSGLIIQAPFTGQPVQINPLTTLSDQIVTVRRIVTPTLAGVVAPAPAPRDLQQVLDLQRIGDDAAGVHQFSSRRGGGVTCPAVQSSATVAEALTGKRLTAAMVASLFASEDGNCPMTLTVYRPGQVRPTGVLVPGAAPVGVLTLSTAGAGGENLDRLTAHVEGRTWTVRFRAAAFPGKAPAPVDYGLSGAGPLGLS